MGIRKCSRCKNGNVLTDWDGPVCVQCGCRPDDALSPEQEAVLRRERRVKRQPRLMKSPRAPKGLPEEVELLFEEDKKYLDYKDLQRLGIRVQDIEFDY